jgi:hypothetical protein
MKPTIVSSVCASVLLAQCATHKQIPDNPIPDTLIYYEHGQLSAEAIKNAYEMTDLVCALPATWEVDFSRRASRLKELYNERIPEDFIEVPETGAQCAFTVMRLDKDLVAVTTHSDMDSDDGLRILRRVPSAWQDITPQAFPYALHKNSRIHGNRDKALIVDGSRFVWKDSRYVKE